MNVKEIQFEEHSSKRIYLNYMGRIRKAVRPLSAIDQKEVLLEFNSHIYEGVVHDNRGTETDRLLDVIERLGDPEEVLKPLIADKKIEQATKTFNPVHLVKALILNVTNGVSYIFFAILYLGLFGFVFLIYAKLQRPDQVGLYLNNHSFMALGKLNDNYLQNPNISEVLGNWFIPAMILSIILSYILITLLLRFKRSINKN